MVHQVGAPAEERDALSSRAGRYLQSNRGHQMASRYQQQLCTHGPGLATRSLHS